MKKELRELYREFSKEYNLSFEDIKEICESPFNLLGHMIKNKEKKVLHLKYWGKYYMKNRLKNDTGGEEQKSDKL